MRNKWYDDETLSLIRKANELQKARLDRAVVQNKDKGIEEKVDCFDFRAVLARSEYLRKKAREEQEKPKNKE